MILAAFLCSVLSAVADPSNSIQLDSELTASYEVSSDLAAVTFTVTSNTSTWLALGVSIDGKMTSSGAGSDAVVCSDGTVKRYWLTTYDVDPTAGVEVNGASCSQKDGLSTMSFTRTFAASGSTTRAISATEATTFIFAHGTSTTVGFHAGLAGSVAWSITPPAPPPATPTTAAPSKAPSTTPPTSPPTTTAPTPGHSSNVVALDSEGTTASFTVNKDDVTFTVTAKSSTWLSLGVSPDGKMTNSGQGADMVICSDGVVKRHWVTSYDVDVKSGVVVAGAMCEQKDGLSTMTFTRDYAQSGDHTREISQEDPTTFIWARGNGRTLGYHGATKGSIGWTIVDGGGVVTARIAPSAALWLHMLFMSLGWGVLLPFGVVFARYQRDNPKKIQGAAIWFAVHRYGNSLGWLIMLGGFAAAVTFTQKDGVAHFTGSYAVHKVGGLVVVILGFLQPFIAAIRPHAHSDKDSRRTVCNDSRTLWELVHKGIGYVAVVGGAANVIYGIVVAYQKNYAYSFIITAGCLCGMLPLLLLYALNKELRPSAKQQDGYSRL